MGTHVNESWCAEMGQIRSYNIINSEFSSIFDLQNEEKKKFNIGFLYAAPKGIIMLEKVEENNYLIITLNFKVIMSHSVGFLIQCDVL